MSNSAKQRSIKILPVRILLGYIITAMLFLTSVELHIHTQESAATDDHGFAVSISSIAGDQMDSSASDEITVSPDSVLKAKQNNLNMLAVFLLIAVLITVLCCSFIGRLRESQALLPALPFYGTPPLRAPPQ